MLKKKFRYLDTLYCQPCIYADVPYICWDSTLPCKNIVMFYLFCHWETKLETWTSVFWSITFWFPCPMIITNRNRVSTNRNVVYHYNLVEPTRITRVYLRGFRYIMYLIVWKSISLDEVILIWLFRWLKKNHR